MSGSWAEPAKRTQTLLRPWEFRFLNKEHQLAGAADWNNPDHDRLWQYNLHYFDDLNAQGASSRGQWHRELLSRWVLENPPAVGVGWEPYPTSLRIVNWIKWSLTGNRLPGECIHSLAVQARWLAKRLEIHLLGNHLFSNAKALIFVGLFFEGSEADGWLEKGLSILKREIPEQILADGGQFERSTMYHALALEDVLDLCNVASAHTGAAPEEAGSSREIWSDVAARMHRWLAAMCHPDGEIGFFNDAAFGVAPAPASLGQYAERLNVANGKVQGDVVLLKDSGYLRVEKGPAVALLDVAPVGPDYLPGHAHADTLSFELSVFGERVIVNSGTSCYGRGEERYRQRKTAAHNTVEVDRADSSEVWAGFRVGRRAYPSVPEVRTTGADVLVSGSHDGYLKLPGGNLHRRSWCFRPGSVSIEDRITGTFREAKARFHLHPDVKPEKHRSTDRGVLRLANGRQLEWEVEGGRLKIEEDSWHPQFGMSVPSKCLTIELLGASLRTTFRWNDESTIEAASER